MQLDTIARHIEGTSPSAFRQVALAFLKLRGYRQPAITDGPNDGGSDIAVYSLPPNRMKLGVQVSVEKDWKSKIEADAIKVKKKLGLQRLHFISSRRIPEALFLPVQQMMLKKHDVDVTRFDNQSISSSFYLENKLDDLLRALELQIEESSAPSADLRRDAAYAYLLFGPDARAFRDNFVESAIKAYYFGNSKGVTREALVKDVASNIGVEKNAEHRVRSSIDRLLQGGVLSLSSKSKLIELSERDRVSLAAQRAVKDREKSDLMRKLERFIAKRIQAKRLDSKALAATIIEDIGALAVNNAALSVELNTEKIDSHVRSAALRAQCQERMRHLATTLEAVGLTDILERETVTKELGQIVSASPYTKDLMACELFVALANTQKEHLANALGSNSTLEVLLDSSVAIPILCGRLYGHTDQRYFSAASNFFSRAKEKALDWFLPEDYLEEVAAHLHLAWENYHAIAHAVSDLSASENAFVAHFVGVRGENSDLSFADYLESYGLTAALRSADQRVAIDALRPKLARLFDRYGIPTKSLRASGASRKHAEEAVSQAINQLDLYRPEVVIRHDITTFAFLNDAGRDASKAMVWCSWDSLCFWLHQYEQPDWIALDPSVLGDLLEVVRGEYSDATLSAPVEYAYMVSTQSAELGARIWDTIARLETKKLSDARLLREAKAFKKDFLANRKQGLARDEIGNAWRDWKRARNVDEDKGASR